MKNIICSVNMERWRFGIDDVIKEKEITEEQFRKAEKGYLDKDERMDIFGATVVWGYGLYGYEFWEEGGKYFVAWKQSNSCD